MQLELPWALGPPDGRYVVRDDANAVTHVLVFATLGAPERRRRRDRAREVAPEPPPTPVTTTRATIVDAEPIPAGEAERWLADAERTTAEAALATLARVVRAHRIASGDASTPVPGLAHALVARAGYGAGERVAEGRWTAARELSTAPPAPRGRGAALRPHERLAALLSGRSRALACEELTLRARQDLDDARLREAALQLRAALDAAVAELTTETVASPTFAARLDELRAAQGDVAALADAALGGALPADAGERLAPTLARLEAALRARAASEASG